jgi:FAD/FMN-containing dehydrogenase
MSKATDYLQNHIEGEVVASSDVRDYFSTDASILKIVPQMVIFPRFEQDVRKVARFAWQLAERGKAIAITARGGGSDLGGAAIGKGIIMSFPAHLNKILTLDSSRGIVTVQSGLNFGHLQQTLQTHGLFLPPAPASLEYSTIGGALANNSVNDASIKYGTLREYARQLRVVLANGEVIETKKLSKREVSRKMGLSTFEGEIYRSLVGLINDHKEVIKNFPKMAINNAGYDMRSVMDKDGSVDLTPLFIGSQGTLGIITEAILETASFNPKKSLAVGYFNDYHKAGEAVKELKKLTPSSLEIVGGSLISFVNKTSPNLLKGILPETGTPHAVVLVQFDNKSTRILNTKTRKAKKIFQNLAYNQHLTYDLLEQEKLLKIRESASVALWESVGTKKALPVIDDSVIPLESLSQFLTQANELFDSHYLEVPFWGHAGDGNIHMQPFFDLNEVGERQKLLKVMDEFYRLVISFKGSISGGYNDGRIRGPYVRLMYGEELYQVFRKVKQIFDPYDTLNPGVKIDVTEKDLLQVMRQQYSLAHFYTHLPRN